MVLFDTKTFSNNNSKSNPPHPRHCNCNRRRPGAAFVALLSPRRALEGKWMSFPSSLFLERKINIEKKRLKIIELRK